MTKTSALATIQLLARVQVAINDRIARLLIFRTSALRGCSAPYSSGLFLNNFDFYP